MSNANETRATQGQQPAYVDWDFAKATGRKLVSGGPSLTRQQARAEVVAIAAAAATVHDPVAHTCRLHTPDDAPPAVVVDRGRWIDANADSMRALTGPAFEKIMGGRSAPPHVAAVGSKVTGAEVGALLAFMASKVLGQYDIAPGGTPQLLLVAPNLVHVQRELEVDPHDFRLWVCMHEEAHRVQFTAVPWLRQHMIDSARSLVGDLAPDGQELGARLQQIFHRLPEALGAGGQGIADLVTTPAQREQLARVTAVMSLLEGHADVVMDDVGPGVIATVADIRAKFTTRRKGVGAFDRLLRRLLGLEAKMAQYRDGAVFVRGVVDRVGWDDFNAIWTSPDTLPLPAEIADPRAWVTRVHG